MANTSSSKGNPASHRMSNKVLKERRASSWRRGEDRKALRRKEQEAAERRNRERRAQGLLTPWETAKAARTLRRAAERAAVPVRGQS